MFVQNGFEVYEKGEPLSAALAKFQTAFKIISPFGFRIVEVDNQPALRVATEEDYRITVAQFRGIKPEDVKVGRGCHMDSPQSCAGFCDDVPGTECTAVYHLSRAHILCLCE